MGRKANTIRTGTSTWYGARDTGGLSGIIKTEGAQNELVFDFTGRSLTDLVFAPTYIPANAVITKAYIQISEAFDLQTSSVLKIGTSGSEATNGVSLTEANLEHAAPWYIDLTSTLAGTWDSEVTLAAKTLVGAAFSAGGLTSGSTAGKARLVVEFTKIK